MSTNDFNLKFRDIAEKAVSINSVQNGYVVRVQVIRDISTPARDAFRAYVCKTLDEVLELVKAIFEA